MEKFKSRKFMMALGGVLTALGAALSGTLPWSDAMNAIVMIVVGYGVAQGAVDVMKVHKNGDAKVVDEEPTSLPSLTASNRDLLVNRYVTIGGMSRDEAEKMIDGIFASLPKLG